MITLENENDIKKVFEICVNEMKRNHLLRKENDAVYCDVSERLYKYYKSGENDIEIKTALKDFKDDIYIHIIPLYYKDKYTIEKIAEMLNVDVSTVVRNKKRLCLSIYLLLE